jgi:hypothetical protein
MGVMQSCTQPYDGAVVQVVDQHVARADQRGGDHERRVVAQLDPFDKKQTFEKPIVMRSGLLTLS